MGDERLEGAQAEAFLAGAFALARDAAVTPTWFELSVRSLEAAYTERPLIAAPTLAFDLTALMHGERLLPIALPAVEGLREALRVYEDHVLARLTADRRWTRLTEALTATPKDLHGAAVGMVVSQLLQRLKLNVGTGVSTGIVRRFANKPIDEVLDSGRAALWDPVLAARLGDGLHLMAKAARRTRDLLSDAEVFLIENLAALKGLGPRVALGQLAEVAQAVTERLPTRLRGNVFEDGDAPTQLEEDSAFPVGGFSSIATVGSLENLVTSELIYMEQGDDPDLRPDLFDVRFVEGELLYYARDESVAVRRKRTLVLVFDPSLVRARVLDAREHYQRLVWALGSVTALVRKLSEWLDTKPCASSWSSCGRTPRPRSTKSGTSPSCCCANSASAGSSTSSRPRPRSTPFVPRAAPTSSGRGSCSSPPECPRGSRAKPRPTRSSTPARNAPSSTGSTARMPRARRRPKPSRRGARPPGNCSTD